LVRYGHLEVSSDNPNYRAAMAKLALSKSKGAEEVESGFLRRGKNRRRSGEEQDLRREDADFSLRDLMGAEWVFKNPRARWCS
jgi:hypothetical protein